MRTLAVIGLLMVCLNSCAHDTASRGTTYAEQISQRPLPTTEQGVAQECGWIRSEIARMQSLGQLAAGRALMVGVVMARNNIATLESRAANLRCGAAFSSPHVIEQKQSSRIDDCIRACKENTSRTSEECFDSCNR